MPAYRSKYFLIVALVDADNGVGLVPVASVPEFVANNTNRPQIAIVVIDLIDRVSPAIANRYTLEIESQRTVIKNFLCQAGNVMSCKGLTSDIKWIWFELRPSSIEHVEEVYEVIGCLIC